MQIIPVLDIQQGLVVRGVGGMRETYRPIVSKLIASAKPFDVAKALQLRFGFSHFYLADLDAIAGAAPSVSLYHDLQSLGLSLSVDAGVRRLADAETILNSGADRVVVALESVHGPDTLAQICQRLAAKRIVFSLDMKSGKPLVPSNDWRTDDPSEIAEQATSCGVREMIVLDLAQVGVNRGVGALELCRSLISTHPKVRLITGGGVRGRDDLLTLNEIGVHGVLIASALHDGRLTQEDVDYVSDRNSQNAD